MDMTGLDADFTNHSRSDNTEVEQKARSQCKRSKAHYEKSKESISKERNLKRIMKKGSSATGFRDASKMPMPEI